MTETTSDVITSNLVYTKSINSKTQESKNRKINYDCNLYTQCSKLSIIV